MWPWKKSSAADKRKMVVNEQFELSSNDGAATVTAAVELPAIAEVPAAAEVTEKAAEEPSVAVEKDEDEAEVPPTAIVEKVYERLIVFDLTGERPFIQNANSGELSREIAMLEINPTFADKSFIANILARRNDLDNYYQNVGVGLPIRSDFGVRVLNVGDVRRVPGDMRRLPNVGGRLPDVGRQLPDAGRRLSVEERRLPEVGRRLPEEEEEEMRQLPGRELRIADDGERQIPNGRGDIRVRADCEHNDDDSDDGIICFYCSVPRNKCSII